MGLLSAAVRGVQVNRTRLLPLAGIVAACFAGALVLPVTRDRVLRYPLATAEFILVVLFVTAFWTVPSDFTRRMRKNPLSVAGFSIIVLFVAVAALAPVLAPPPQTSRDAYLIPQEGFASDPKPPQVGHPFGTTEGQYDLYYGIIWGTRTAFRVSITVIAISVVVGLFLGGFPDTTAGDSTRSSCASRTSSWRSPDSSWPWWWSPCLVVASTTS